MRPLTSVTGRCYRALIEAADVFGVFFVNEIKNLINVVI
jgi:hypothetical protein